MERVREFVDVVGIHDVDALPHPWNDAEPTFRSMAKALLAFILAKCLMQPGSGFPVTTHERAFYSVVYSILVYGLASGISAISRGTFYVIARWVTAVSAFFMVAFMIHLACFLISLNF